MPYSISVERGECKFQFDFDLEDGLSVSEKARRAGVICRAYRTAADFYYCMRTRIEKEHRKDADVTIDMKAVRKECGLRGGAGGEDESHFVLFLAGIFEKTGFQVIHCGFGLDANGDIIDGDNVYVKVKKN